MTSVRKSIIFGFEKEFGKGLGEGQEWMHVPPGSFMSHTHTRSTNRIDAAGSKKYDAIAQGKVSGTWSWGFKLDYNQLEPFLLVFEDVNGKSIGGEDMAGTNPEGGRVKVVATVRGDDIEYSRHLEANGDWLALSEVPADPVAHKVYQIYDQSLATYSYFVDGTTLSDWNDYITADNEQVDGDGNEYSADRYSLIMEDGEPHLFDNDEGKFVTKPGSDVEMWTHVFKKVNGKRIPSFCVRIVTQNIMAGGPCDEVLELRGCVVKTCSFRQSAGASQTEVTMEGFSTREYMYLSPTPLGNDYKMHDGQLTEFGCTFIGGGKDTPLAEVTEEDNRIAYVDAFSVEISNNADQIDSTCTPFTIDYYEGKTENGLSMSIYSNNPLVLQQRVYSGGEGTFTTGSYLFQPKCKNLAPLPRAAIAAYNTCCRDDTQDEDGNSIIARAIARATKSVIFDLYGIVIKQMGWQRGEGQKLQDQISSAECWDIQMYTKGDVEDWSHNGKNYCLKPVGPRYDNESNKWVND